MITLESHTKNHKAPKGKVYKEPRAENQAILEIVDRFYPHIGLWTDFSSPLKSGVVLNNATMNRCNLLQQTQIKRGEKKSKLCSKNFVFLIDY